MRLGNTPIVNSLKYQITNEEIHEIKEYLNYNYPLGNNRFKQQIEKALAATSWTQSTWQAKRCIQCWLNINHSDPCITRFQIGKNFTWF